MKKLFFLFPLCVLLFFSNCDNSSKKNAEAQKAAADEKEAVTLDSISNILDQEKAAIEADVQKLEESLQSMEE
ncbi:MAG: hypothetical protein Q7T20_06295 [Saprospiraceae bacterium]|nr:hypothetical protein [Saprospiraceae bacterium]